MFLVRLAFALFLVAMLLPAGPGEEKAPGVSIVETMAAARDALVDISGLCERQAEACTTGREVLGVLGEKARQGAAVVYRYIETQVDAADKTNGPVERGTLTNDDVRIPWQEPKIRGSV